MATYHWTGTTSSDITVASNWHGGQVPAGSPDTIVNIGILDPLKTNPTITRWPDGGHLDMEIGELHVVNTAVSGIDKGSIGSSSNYLKASNVRRCYLGGGSDPAGMCDLGWPWGSIDIDPAPVAPMEEGSHTYLHLESPTNGPDTELHIKSCVDYSHTASRYYFHLRGNPGIVWHSVSEAEIHIEDAPLAIDGSTPVKGEQGPVGMVHTGPLIMGVAMDIQKIGLGIRNSAVYLDWQSGAMSGNPVDTSYEDLLDNPNYYYNTGIDISSSTINLNAQDITDFSVTSQTSVSTERALGNATWDEKPGYVNMQHAGAVSEEVAAVACTAFSIDGFSLDIDPANYVPPVVTFLSGTNFGTFTTQAADVIFSPKAAFRTMIIDGNIGPATRLDASAIEAGDWILGYLLTGIGVKIAGGTHTKIKPPMNSNIRIA